jgi:starch phosphorylase
MVPIDDENVTVQVWRVDVGRVPLYLLDTDLAVNSQRGRWITSRLYEGNRAIRLAQYAVLGVGGVRALRALGIEPAVYHFNEGHPALGVFELLAQAQALAPPDGAVDALWHQVREQVVFTTHTPVPAGNETYQRAEVLTMLGRIADLVGEREDFLALGRVDPANPNQAMSMSVLALRASRHANAVSQRHGQVARAMCPRSQDRPQDVPSPTSPTACISPAGCAAPCAPCWTATWATAGCAAPTRVPPGPPCRTSLPPSCGRRAAARAPSWLT